MHIPGGVLIRIFGLRVHSATHCSSQPCVNSHVLIVCQDIYHLYNVYVVCHVHYCLTQVSLKRFFLATGCQRARPTCLLILHLQRHRTGSFPVPDSFVDCSVASPLMLSFCILHGDQVAQCAPVASHMPASHQTSAKDAQPPLQAADLSVRDAGR